MDGEIEREGREKEEEEEEEERGAAGTGPEKEGNRRASFTVRFFVLFVLGFNS